MNVSLAKTRIKRRTRCAREALARRAIPLSLLAILPLADVDAQEVWTPSRCLGDSTEAIDTLENKLLGADVMVISCARLIRIDFSAAGTLLNWVTARQAEGRQVQFVEVHRLVAAFFNVIGISEHARVMARTD